jgi:hypothetical protein
VGTTKRRYSKEEVGKRGDDIFEKEIQPHVRDRDPMEFVAIDIETSAYEVDVDQLKACRRLRKRIPQAQIWLRRVGSRFVCHFGGYGFGGKR